jgi:integrase/recombinase XerD
LRPTARRAAIAATSQAYRLIFLILREIGMRADEGLSLNVGDIIA